MHCRFMPHVLRLAGPLSPGMRVLDVGCGNGYTCGEFLRLGCTVVGVDLSEKGIVIARKTYPDARFEIIGAESDVLSELGEAPFDVVVSTEVVEHLYAPRRWAKACFDALRPGGKFICTTPYHGYLKNLALAVLGRWNRHMNPLWDGGHIKLWSKSSLQQLLQEVGFRDLHFKGAGRLPSFWMTMIMVGTRPR